MEIIYQDLDLSSLPEAQEVMLYEEVGWTNYLKQKDHLFQGIRNSDTVIGAYDGEALIGLIRLVGDKYTIVYIQDILVRPSHQGKGIGRKLIELALEKYPEVRQKVLLTDNEEKLKNFYQEVGFVESGRLNLTCFVNIK